MMSEFRRGDFLNIEHQLGNIQIFCIRQTSDMDGGGFKNFRNSEIIDILLESLNTELLESVHN